MPLITSTGKDYLSMYDGFNQQKVGLGLINPNIYATPEYQKTKVQSIMIGGLNEVVYSGMEHDTKPKILTIKYEQQYSTILAYNLNYCPIYMRQAILKVVLDSNAARIKGNQPILIDYKFLSKAVPDSIYIIRRYKVVGLNVRDTIPLVEWPTTIKQKSNWESHYRKFKQEAANSKKRR